MSVAMLRFGHCSLLVSEISIAERATRRRSSTNAARIRSKSCLGVVAIAQYRGVRVPTAPVYGFTFPRVL